MRHEESKIQQVCVEWFRYQFPEYARNLVAIPNGYKTTLSQARIAKAEGMVAGAADLFLFVPSHNGKYHGLAIEMKTAKGRQQESQKIWQQCIQREGYHYVICRSFDDFRMEINNYLCVR